MKKSVPHNTFLCATIISSKTITGKDIPCRFFTTQKRREEDVTDYYDVSYRRSDSLLTIRSGSKVNRFYVFGGKDESSYALIQGMTLSGVLFDEVALMPKSFVDQALARTLSEPLARYWFNCNPESSEHWFYKEWIRDTAALLKLGKLHFCQCCKDIIREFSLYCWDEKQRDKDAVHKATPHKARLTALHAICLQLFRHISQKASLIHKVAAAFFVSSDKKSDCASYAQSLCDVALK